MALTIPQVLRQFKADVAKALSAETILKICGYLGHVSRKRVLGPVTTVHVFLLQILHGNTACTAVSRLAGVTFTAGAYCLARKRLPLALFRDLLERVCDALFPEIQDTARWLGHRTWTLDGSSFSMPDTERCKLTLASPRRKPKAVGFRWRTCWLCSMPAPVCCCGSWPRPCERTTCAMPQPCTRS